MSKHKGTLTLKSGVSYPAVLDVRKYRAAPDYDPDIQWHYCWDLRAYWTPQKNNIRATLKSRQSHDSFDAALHEAAAFGFSENMPSQEARSGARRDRDILQEASRGAPRDRDTS